MFRLVAVLRESRNEIFLSCNVRLRRDVPVNVSGTQLPNSTECPKCHLTIWLVEPLGNVVGMAILGRAATELKNGDWTLTIVLGAMAVECELIHEMESDRPDVGEEPERCRRRRLGKAVAG